MIVLPDMEHPAGEGATIAPSCKDVTETGREIERRELDSALIRCTYMISLGSILSSHPLSFNNNSAIMFRMIIKVLVQGSGETRLSYVTS